MQAAGPFTPNGRALSLILIRKQDGASCNEPMAEPDWPGLTGEENTAESRQGNPIGKGKWSKNPQTSL
jgi:hypothetical protein